MSVLNPYHRAAVLKQQSMRALRLPSCDMGFPMSPMVDAFLESTAGHRWAGRNGTSLQLARKLSDREIDSLITWYEACDARSTSEYSDAVGGDHAHCYPLNPSRGLVVLQRVKADRAS